MANIQNSWEYVETSVDSLKVRIPLQDVEVLNESLHYLWATVNTGTLEIDESKYKEYAYSLTNQGITVRFLIENQVTDKQVVDTFLTVLFPSKVLKEKYFEGLTLENIHLAHSYLMSLEVVKFSLETFLQGQCTDVDFKKDRIIGLEDFYFVVKECANRTIPKASKKQGYETWPKDVSPKKPPKNLTNLGIEWTDRKTTKYMTSPYVKLYHKELELKNKSNEFASAFLTGVDFKNVVRAEATIKNRKHFKLHGVEDTSLRSILSITSEIKDAFIARAIKLHIDESGRSKVPREGLSPRDAMLVNMFQQCMERGMSWRVIRETNLDAIERQANFEDEKSVVKTRVAKWREEKHIDKLYQTYILDTPYDKFTKKLDETFGDFFKWLGYDS